MLSVGADADLTQTPTFDCSTIAGCYPEPSPGFTVITLGHRKFADWVNLESASTSALTERSLPTWARRETRSRLRTNTVRGIADLPAGAAGSISGCAQSI